MKTLSLLTITAATQAVLVAAKHGNAHLNVFERRHNHHKGRAMSAAELGVDLEVREVSLEKRTGQCEFPSDAGLVAVPGQSNGGWAMSPDQCCEPGGYCPYACPPGQVSMQWDPSATSYSYPISMVSNVLRPTVLVLIEI